MIYCNDNIIIKDETVTGKIKDIKTYFRYEIASQSMTGDDCDFENYADNVKNIIKLLENLYNGIIDELYNDDDIIKVIVHPMGGYIIETGAE